MDTGVIIAVSLLVPAIALGRWGKRLRPLPISKLELAFTPAKVDTLLARWNANARVRKSIYIDFFLIPCYVAFLWFLCNLIGDRRFAYAALLAGALDFFVENPVMLLELDGRSNALLTFVKALASLIKWVLLLGIVAWLVYEMD